MASIERQVNASTDDAVRRLEHTSFWNITWPHCWAGAFDNWDYRYGSGMRFTNITIPKGATITEAHLTLRCASALSGATVNTRISAEDVDDAPTFADNADAFDARYANHTTAMVDWDDLPPWTLDEDYDSPDIKTVIQEIVDRAGWNSGQDIVIFWEDFDDRSSHVTGCTRRGYAYDESTEFCEKLVVTYTVPGWQGKVSGVTNPAKIMGVPVANIAKVKGVASA